MVRRMSVSQFRTAIREVVSKAENGVPTVLTHYKRDAVAIVPMSMFQPNTTPDRGKPPVPDKPRLRRTKAS